MHVLLVGRDTRLHAVAKAVSRSKLLTKLYAAPGNAGINEHAQCVAIEETDSERLVAFCVEKRIDLVFISAELPIALGVADALREANILVCAPSKAAAQLESDKLFACAFAQENGVPSPVYAATNEPQNVKVIANCLRHDYGGKRVAPDGTIVENDTKGLGGVFIKANGLCEGKGVFPGRTDAEVEEAYEELVVKYRFGDQTYPIVMQEALDGKEMSVFFGVTASGKTIYLGEACDKKTAGAGEPNGGGWGGYSPSGLMTPEIFKRTLKEIVEPTVAGLIKNKTPYAGILFFGLMITADGPKLIEYNCRLGMPEAEIILERITDDLLMLLYQIATDTLEKESATIDPDPALCVVVAGPDYPYENGRPGGIANGFTEAARRPNVSVYHRHSFSEGNQVRVGSGRAFSITARGRTMQEARQRAYEAVGDFHFENGIKYRADIGQDVP